MKKRALTYIAIILAAIILITLIILCPKNETTQPNTQLPNPASQHCQDNNGTLEIIDGEDGQYGLCHFDDESMCEEWAFFREECTKGKLKIDITNCESYFDGCNTCTRLKEGLFECTEMACKTLQEQKCLD